MKPRKTAYDKVTELVQQCPNNATVKTALRWFSDGALLRELQRRNAMPKLPVSLPWVGNDDLAREAEDRGYLMINRAEFKLALDRKDWEEFRDMYWGEGL